MEKKSIVFPSELNAGIRVPAAGPSTASIAIVGGAPGSVELKRKQPLVGPSGIFLHKILAD